jgi:hypothetical protein
MVGEADNAGGRSGLDGDPGSVIDGTIAGGSRLLPGAAPASGSAAGAGEGNAQETEQRNRRACRQAADLSTMREMKRHDTLHFLFPLFRLSLSLVNEDLQRFDRNTP